MVLPHQQSNDYIGGQKEKLPLWTLLLNLETILKAVQIIAKLVKAKWKQM